MKTKDEIHELIETIEDEEVLSTYLQLIKMLNNSRTGELWNNLASDEKNDVLMSYQESFDSKNLISHKEVKKQHTRWLEK